MIIILAALLGRYATQSRSYLARTERKRKRKQKQKQSLASMEIESLLERVSSKELLYSGLYGCFQPYRNEETNTCWHVETQKGLEYNSTIYTSVASRYRGSPPSHTRRSHKLCNSSLTWYVNSGPRKFLVERSFHVTLHCTPPLDRIRSTNTKSFGAKLAFSRIM
jgi:5-methylcytosine-specific restriction endonuclease McrA